MATRSFAGASPANGVIVRSLSALRPACGPTAVVKHCQHLVPGLADNPIASSQHRGTTARDSPRYRTAAFRLASRTPHARSDHATLAPLQAAQLAARAGLRVHTISGGDAVDAAGDPGLSAAFEQLLASVYGAGRRGFDADTAARLLARVTAPGARKTADTSGITVVPSAAIPADRSCRALRGIRPAARHRGPGSRARPAPPA